MAQLPCSETREDCHASAQSRDERRLHVSDMNQREGAGVLPASSTLNIAPWCTVAFDIAVDSLHQFVAGGGGIRSCDMLWHVSPPGERSKRDSRGR